MITYDQAIGLRHGAEIHKNGCTRHIGPRGGVREDRIVYRVSGAVKTWKTRAGEFQVPIKYGFYGPSGYLTHANASDFHLPDDCEPREVTHARAV